MLRIRKDDKVMVMAGKDKGKVSRVLKVFPQIDRALVENVNVVKKAVRKSDQYPQGGFIELEKPIHISNIMVIDKKTNKPTRVGTNILKDGSKVRVSKATGEVI